MSGREIFLLWSDIQDLIGKASLWPQRIRYLFWKKQMSHWERILICAFTYVNGLNPEILLQWVTLNNLCVADDSHYSHLKRVLQYMTEGRYARSLYAWNVTTNRPEYLNGEVRLYNRRRN